MGHAGRSLKGCFGAVLVMGGGVLVTAEPLVESEADGDGVIDLGHDLLVQMSHLLPQTALIRS